MTAALYVLVAWLAGIAWLLVAIWPISHPRTWGWKERLLVAGGPLTLTWHMYKLIRIAHHSRYVATEPTAARYRCSQTFEAMHWREANYAHSTAEKTGTGDWFTNLDRDRAYEVMCVDWNHWYGWTAQVRAVDPDRFGTREYWWLSSWDLHEGTWKPYTPPELAPFNHLRG